MGDETSDGTPPTPKPGEKTASFAPRPTEQSAGTTQSFAPLPAAAPPQTQWSTPGAAQTAPAPPFTLAGEGATSPPPGPMSTASFAPVQPQPAQPVASLAPAEPAPAVAPAQPEAAPSAAPIFALPEAEPPEAPAFPPRPSTMILGLLLAAIQAVAMIAGGALLLVLANGSGDWLQKRLDDWNSSHSATSLDTFRHATDVVGAGAVGLGVIVLLLAGSSLLYGQSSRWLLAGAQVLIIVVSAVGVIVSPLSLVFALDAIVVIALILAPQTSRSFRTAKDAEEEWRARL